MNRIATALLLAAFAVPAWSADVGVSITIGEPGFYGRIDIGDFPPPVLIYPEPVVIERVHVARAPLYLHVPPGHAKNWRKHCHRYNACARPVYFVEDRWYNDVYVPAWRERHGHGRHDGHRSERPGKKADRPGKPDHPHGPPHDRGRGHRD